LEPSEQLYTLSKDEVELLVLELGNRNWWAKQDIVDFPIAKNAVSQMFAHLCNENLKFSQNYLKEIMTQISSGNFITIKRCERSLLDFI
jgi:hypothetical protein